MAAKFRSFLTILGIIIGVASVIIIFAIGRSAQELILDQIRGVGSNLIAIMPGASEEDGPPAAVMGVTITTLQYDDLLALRKKNNISEIESVAGYVSGTATLTYKDIDLNVSFTGTTNSYLETEDTKIIYGRFFNLEEETNLSRVAVLGTKVAKDLFSSVPMTEIIGRKIKIDKNKFTIIGILEERDSAAFGIANQNDTVFIPVVTAQKLLLGINHLALIRAKINSSENILLAKENIKNILREQHKIDNSSNDDFSVRDQSSALEMVDKITDALRYFLLTVGTISLLVGGIGIMNVMLIAVSQRVREVGLRKAVGATNGEVLWQFIIEAGTISFIGGVVGIILGIAVSLLVSIAVNAFGYNWQFLISGSSIIVATIVAILIGLIFGVYPARKASKISPMEALRYE